MPQLHTHAQALLKGTCFPPGRSYSAEDVKMGKAAAKKLLRERMGLSTGDIPIVAVGLDLPLLHS